MRLATFQLKSIADLMEAMSGPEQEIILKSCTGSGKTSILSHFMDEYGKSFFRKVFVWLTPARVIWRNRARPRWISTSMAAIPNCWPM